MVKKVQLQQGSILNIIIKRIKTDVTFTCQGVVIIDTDLSVIYHHTPTQNCFKKNTTTTTTTTSSPALLKSLLHLWC